MPKLELDQTPPQSVFARAQHSNHQQIIVPYPDTLLFVISSSETRASARHETVLLSAMSHLRGAIFRKLLAILIAYSDLS